MPTIQIAQADPADLPAVLALLAESNLPHDGLAEHFGAALVARDGERVVGSAALELYGEAGLPRSVAIAPELRGQSLGRELTLAALELSRERGIHQLYLLTTTAEGYFPAFGFALVSRAEVAPALHTSAEFTGACPDSAAVLALSLSH